MKLKTKIMTITLDNEQHDQIKEDAKKQNKSVSAFIRELHDLYTSTENRKKKMRLKQSQLINGQCDA